MRSPARMAEPLRTSRLLAGAMLLLLLLLASGPAMAHAQPVSAAPANGAVVQVPPREVVILFSEDLDRSFSTMEVRSSTGTTVSQPSVIDGDGLTMRARLPENLAYGTYSISWRVQSTVDGHSTRGLLAFLFPDPSQPLRPEDLPPSASATQVVTAPGEPAWRALNFLGIFAVLGTATLVLLGRRSNPWPVGAGLERRLAKFAAAAALGSTAASALLLVLQWMAVNERGLGDVLAQPAALFANTSGRMAGLRLVLMAAAAAVAWRIFHHRGTTLGTGPWWGCAGLSVAAAATNSLSSHAAALGSPALPVLNDLIHYVAAAAWVGALAGLGWLVLRNGTEQPPVELVRRFSSVATVAVAVVVVSGVAASIVHVRSLDVLWNSSYGQTLVAKLALVGVLLGFGARNRLVLVPRVARSAGEELATAVRRLGRSVRMESLAGVAVLVAAGLLTTYSPPPPVAAATPPPVAQFEDFSEGVNGTLLITPSPVRVGLTTLDLFLYVGGVSDGNATNATFTFRPPDRSLGDSVVKPQKAHIGHFATEGTFFTTPGTWLVRAVVQRTGEFDLVLEFRVDVEG